MLSFLLAGGERKRLVQFHRPTGLPAKLVFERAEGTGRVLNSLVCSGAAICGATAQGSEKIPPEISERR